MILARLSRRVCGRCWERPWCWACGHRWEPAGYALSYRPGGRDHRDVCARCGKERRRHNTNGSNDA